jgi:hypothetical protein
MSDIEKDILEVTQFEPPRKYDDRQDYLAALCRALNKLEDIDFNSLSDDSNKWFNDAVRAMNNRKDLPEFPDLVETESEDTNTGGIQDSPAEEGEAEVEKPKAAPKAEHKRRAKGTPPRKLEHAEINTEAATDTPQVDAYGVVKGSKNAAAVSMLEKGCRMSDITHSIGGTYYNLVERLRKAGHNIEKGANGHIKLTNKDN